MYKNCSRCKRVLPLSSFDKSKGKNYYHSMCKECESEIHKIWYKNNREKVIKRTCEYQKFYRDKNREKVRIAAKKRAAKNRLKLSKNSKKWALKNKEKAIIYVKVSLAIKQGKLIKPNSCELCGGSDSKIHAHHENYNEPLIVKWLCPLCHKKAHVERKAA